MAKHLLWLLLWGSTIAVITPMHQAHTCDWVLALGLKLSKLAMKLSKLVQRQKRECSCVEQNSENSSSWAPKNGLSASPEKIQSIRGENLEISRALTGSVPRKMGRGLQRVSAPCLNRVQVARFIATRFNHSATDSCYLDEKKNISLVD